ncbi:head-tail adaptor protein [Pseudooceanicola nitratireducens]|jgi:head-tail adaptor|uniref:head-tail adaptor protein n=1 Tax=Pseudooceanicola nitratireducens TaxID=517719 RepID=UPI003104D062
MSPRLNRLLVLEDRQRQPDGSGGYSEAWVALGEIWADVSARTGRGTDLGPLATARTGYRIVVRGAPVGTPSRPVAGQRFREGPRLFRIEAVAERDSEGRYLICFAHEEVAA